METRPLDLELLRSVFKDKRVHIALGKITKIAIASDRSMVRAWVSIFPEQREIITRMTWEAVGPEAGIFMLPNPNDLVLVGFVDGDDDHAFVLKRITSQEDKIPIKVLDGDIVVKSLQQKKVWMTSDSKILLSRGEKEPSEPLVLGLIFKQMMSELLEALSVHKHVGNLGYTTTIPDNSQKYNSIRSENVDNEKVLSDICFTEK